MRYARVGDTLLIRLMTGEAIVGSLLAVAEAEHIGAASVSGIGAAHDVELGYFDRAARQYERYTVHEELEVVSLSGTLGRQDGRPIAHVHAALSRRDGSLIGGHLFEGYAGATIELIVRPLPGELRRTKDESTGLFLLDLLPSPPERGGGPG